VNHEILKKRSSIKSPFHHFHCYEAINCGIHDINTQLIAVRTDPIHARIYKVTETLDISTRRPESRIVILEILMGNRLVNKFNKFLGTRSLVTVFMKSSNCPLS
jgi:hypothetical protein